jgi:hypothetical protein
MIARSRANLQAVVEFVPKVDGLEFLAGEAEIRNHGDDVAGRSTFGSIYHHKKL